MRNVATECSGGCDGPPSAVARQGASERLLADLYRADHLRLRSYLSGILKCEADADCVQQCFRWQHDDAQRTLTDQQGPPRPRPRAPALQNLAD